MLFNSPKQSPFLLIYPTMLFDSFIFLHFIAFSCHGFLTALFLFSFDYFASSKVFSKWYIISGYIEWISDVTWKQWLCMTKYPFSKCCASIFTPKKHLQNTCNLFVFFLHNGNHFGHFCLWLLLSFIFVDGFFFVFF